MRKVVEQNSSETSSREKEKEKKKKRKKSKRDKEKEKEKGDDNSEETMRKELAEVKEQLAQFQKQKEQKECPFNQRCWKTNCPDKHPPGFKPATPPKCSDCGKVRGP